MNAKLVLSEFGPKIGAASPWCEPRNKTPVDKVTDFNSPAATSVTNRYGTPKRALSKKAKILILAVVAVLSLTWIVWATVGNAAVVSQKVLSYQVVDSTMSTVDLSVTKDPGATAKCALKAMNATFAVVGWNVITVGPNSTSVGSENGRTTTVRGEVRTDSLAVTGTIESCWLVQ